MAERPSTPLWDRTAVEPDISPAGRVGGSVDLAVVGGGYTGLSTALHAAEYSIDCHVLEARRVGYGGSGRNVGLVNAGLWLPPQDIRARLGDRKGGALISALGDGPAYVMSLIERHRISCEATRTGTVHAAHSPAGLGDLERRAAEWQRLGAPVELLDRTTVAEKVGSGAYHGGLLDRRAGTVNPAGYVRGLARAASAAGAAVSVGVAVTGLTREGDRWALETARGRISARRVVLATNAYTDRLWPGLKDSFTIVPFFQVATEPLGERAGNILPGREGLWDTGRIMFSLRKDAGGRLVVGSMGRAVGGRNGLSERWAASRLRRLFPGLGDVAFEEAWDGDIAMTPDHLPRIHRLADGLYAAGGYNGRGIAPGTVFGRAIAAYLSGGREDDLPLPVTEPKPASAAARILSRGYRAAFAANQFLKSR